MSTFPVTLQDAPDDQDLRDTGHERLQVGLTDTLGAVFFDPRGNLTQLSLEEIKRQDFARD